MRKLFLALPLLAATANPAAADPGHIGVMVDAGVPDGVNGALIYRPWNFLYVHGGGGYNLISPGIRGGASLYLLPWVVSPSLNVEAGHYFPGNANNAVMKVSGEDPDSPLLESVGYDYQNLHL